MNPSDSLYVHIPFCAAICPYCDFPKVIYRSLWAQDYIPALEVELKARNAGLFDTLYVGGGTPSCLDEAELSALLSLLRPHLRPEAEFSFECNPDSLTEEKLVLMKEAGVNRISIGAQSSTPKSLASLGRNHDFGAVRRAVELSRNAGIANINVDWMVGFPKQSEEDLDEDICAFLSLGVPHLSVYTLILEPQSVYGVMGVAALNDDTQHEYFQKAKNALVGRGYERYEISNFAKPGYRCRHNLTYWNDHHYMGVGLGAAGYLGNVRYKNTLSLSKYLRGDYRDEEEILDKESELEDYFLTNLRLIEGFETRDFIERFSLPTWQEYQSRFASLSEKGLLQVTATRIHCSERGLDLLDRVLLALF